MHLAHVLLIVDQVGSAWYNTTQQVLAGFTTKFQFQILDRSAICKDVWNMQFTGLREMNKTYYSRRKTYEGIFMYNICLGKGADGFAFTIRGGSSMAEGRGGAQLGYGGINNSLAIEFDTWYNNLQDRNGDFSMEGASHISVQTRGLQNNSAFHSSSIASIPLTELKNSSVKTVVIKYHPMNFSLEHVHEDVIDNDRVALRQTSRGKIQSLSMSSFDPIIFRASFEHATCLEIPCL